MKCAVCQVTESPVFYCHDMRGSPDLTTYASSEYRRLMEQRIELEANNMAFMYERRTEAS